MVTEGGGISCPLINLVVQMTQLNRHEQETLLAFPLLKDLPGLKSQDERDAFLLRLYESGFVCAFTNFVLHKMLEDHTFFPFGSEGVFIVMGGPNQGLIIRSFSPSPKTLEGTTILHSQSNDVSMVLVSKESISFTNYTYDYDTGLSVYENFKRQSLDEGALVRLDQGKLIRIQANRDVGDYSAITKSAVFLAVTTKTDCKYTFAFDKETRLPLQTIDATNHDTRIEYISRVFAALQFKEAVPEMLKLLSSSSASGRWRLARDILSLDNETGKEVIRDLSKNDFDDQVRSVAKRSLALLGLEVKHG
jgi:hypothetical protein